MSSEFGKLDGAARVRADEADWAAAIASAGVPPELAGALAPLAEPTADVPDSAVVSAAELSVGPAQLHLDVTTVSGDRGLIASFGSDGVVAASAARVLLVPRGGEATSFVPGVELSLFRAEHLVGEIMRLLPPDAPFAASSAAEPITVRHADALVLSQAVQSGDQALAAQIAADNGWDEVPEVLSALADGVRANATIAFRVAGRSSLVVRRWLQSELGWVGIAIADGTIVHTPCSRQDVANELTYSLTGAFEVALAGVGHRG